MWDNDIKFDMWKCQINRIGKITAELSLQQIWIRQDENEMIFWRDMTDSYKGTWTYLLT